MLWWALLVLVSTPWAIGEAKTPNILFILADDLGYGDLEVYPNPSPRGRISTPHLNALASQGMVFTDVYAGAPVCAPSRCALMTGKHTGHCTVRENGQVLNSSDITIASILQKEGYHTGLIGKWGLGSTDYPPATNVPNPEGFDFFLGYNSQENAHNYYPYFLFHNKDKMLFPANQNASAETCGQPLTQHCVWAQDIFVNTTIQFLQNVSKSDNPFYLFLSFTTPHAGGIGNNKETGVPSPYEIPQYANQTWPKGQIISALDILGMADNTVVFYASDNGAHNEGGHSYEYFQSSGPLRGYKRSLHEGGVRSPLIVRWPGVTPPDTASNQQWGFWDFMATAADIAGVSPDTLPPNDGYSLLPTLQGNTQAQPKYSYHEYCYPNEDKSGFGQAVRFNNWKAVRYDFQETVELYDLAYDIGETVDLSEQYPYEVVLAVQYMVEAHVPGPHCGYLPPHPNTLSGY